MVLSDKPVMKTSKMYWAHCFRRINCCVLLAVISIGVNSCNHFRANVEFDKAAGYNGGFEVVKKGLPVNWLFTAESNQLYSDFEVISDSLDFREGKRSVRFSVKKCSEEGGWKSPGLANEFYGTGKFMGPGEYRVSLWVKSKKSTARFTVSSASPGNIYSRLVWEIINATEWKQLEYKVKLSEGNWLRVELEILKPGEFWVDDIQISKLN